MKYFLKYYYIDYFITLDYLFEYNKYKLFEFNI